MGRKEEGFFFCTVLVLYNYRISHRRWSIKRYSHKFRKINRATGQTPETLSKNFDKGVFLKILRKFKSTFFTEHLQATASAVKRKTWIKNMIKNTGSQPRRMRNVQKISPEANDCCSWRPPFIVSYFISHFLGVFFLSFFTGIFFRNCSLLILFKYEANLGFNRYLKFRL